MVLRVNHNVHYGLLWHRVIGDYGQDFALSGGRFDVVLLWVEKVHKFWTRKNPVIDWVGGC